jgi:hypothetical protein
MFKYFSKFSAKNFKNFLVVVTEIVVFRNVFKVNISFKKFSETVKVKVIYRKFTYINLPNFTFR